MRCHYLEVAGHYHACVHWLLPPKPSPSAIDTDQKKNKKFQRKRYIVKYIYAHIFSCTPKYQLESVVGILLCRKSMNYLKFIENSHILVYFYCTEEISVLIPLCSTLWHTWRWCFRGVTQHPWLDRAIPTEYCCFAYVINPVTAKITIFRNFYIRILNSFVPCHQNVYAFFYTSTPGSVSAQHLLQYFEFILFIFCFIFLLMYILCAKPKLPFPKYTA